MRLVIGGGGEENLIGGDKRQRSAIGKVKEARFDLALAGEMMPLHFDIETVRKELFERGGARESDFWPRQSEGAAERAIRAPRQSDESGRSTFKAAEGDVRRIAGRRVEPGARRYIHKI
jgi:hypothetical protein